MVYYAIACMNNAHSIEIDYKKYCKADKVIRSTINMSTKVLLWQCCAMRCSGCSGWCKCMCGAECEIANVAYNLDPPRLSVPGFFALLSIRRLRGMLLLSVLRFGRRCTKFVLINGSFLLLLRQFFVVLLFVESLGMRTRGSFANSRLLHFLILMSLFLHFLRLLRSGLFRLRCLRLGHTTLQRLALCAIVEVGKLLEVFERLLEVLHCLRRHLLLVLVIGGIFSLDSRLVGLDRILHVFDAFEILLYLGNQAALRQLKEHPCHGLLRLTHPRLHLANLASACRSSLSSPPSSFFLIIIFVLFLRPAPSTITTIIPSAPVHVVEQEGDHAHCVDRDHEGEERTTAALARFRSSRRYIHVWVHGPRPAARSGPSRTPPCHARMHRGSIILCLRCGFRSAQEGQEKRVEDVR
ncbi:hypothetical protein PMAYCL1PPCAC_20106, partial [Pristionchus mayeri]